MPGQCLGDSHSSMWFKSSDVTWRKSGCQIWFGRHKVTSRETACLALEMNIIHRIIRIRKVIRSNFRRNQSTGMVLMDIKAAFDSVWPFYKRNQWYFSIELIKIIKNLKKKISQFIFVVTSLHTSKSQLEVLKALVCSGELSVDIITKLCEDILWNKRFSIQGINYML